MRFLSEDDYEKIIEAWLASQAVLAVMSNPKEVESPGKVIYQKMVEAATNLEHVVAKMNVLSKEEIIRSIQNGRDA